MFEGMAKIVHLHVVPKCAQVGFNKEVRNKHRNSKLMHSLQMSEL